MRTFIRTTAYVAASKLSAIIGQRAYSIAGLARMHRRISDQRHRNRIIEAVDVLADGSAGLNAFGADLHFGEFLVLTEASALQRNSALSKAECAGLQQLVWSVRQVYGSGRSACDTAPATDVCADAIAQEAEQLLSLFSSRGFFHENVDEPEPTAKAYL